MNISGKPSITISNGLPRQAGDRKKKKTQNAAKPARIAWPKMSDGERMASNSLPEIRIQVQP
jgi:hypothetical protein